MDCNLPGSSVHGSSQARIMEWVAISFSMWSFQPRDQTGSSFISKIRFPRQAESNGIPNTNQDILFYLFIFFNFTILYWFCHISKWIHHRYTCVPHPEPSSLLPPRTIPLGRPSAPAPSIQYRASNLDWRFISYMTLYMFQCHSPKSSHPLPLPQSPKNCSIHQCLFCCLVYRVIVTIFLNSISHSNQGILKQPNGVSKNIPLLR